MKTVGKQLQEARLAKNWTPELAARETKIKIDRLRDLEADDYSHFSSPTYARGFVRTYARSLGLDEYKILRQLDNKLPDDDSANIVTDGGIAYLPETSMPPRAAHRDYTGLYVVMGLGAVVALAIVVILIQAYRVGELPGYFANANSAPTNATNPVAPATESVARALPVDSNTPPAIPDTNAPVAGGSSAEPVAPRALPVDPSQLAMADTNAATEIPADAPRALPVDPSQLNNPAPSATDTNSGVDATPAPPRALPVSPADLAAAGASVPPSAQQGMSPTLGASTPTTATPSSAAPVTPPPDAPPADVTPTAAPASSKPSNNGPVMEPSLPAVQPATPSANAFSPDGDKRLVLTASQDSFVSVIDRDSSDSSKPIYASVLHSGQSVGFDGRKFTINVGVPSAVDIKLDGVNYGPHSDHAAPETFNVESHLP